MIIIIDTHWRHDNTASVCISDGSGKREAGGPIPCPVLPILSLTMTYHDETLVKAMKYLCMWDGDIERFLEYVFCQQDIRIIGNNSPVSGDRRVVILLLLMLFFIIETKTNLFISKFYMFCLSSEFIRTNF